MVTFLLIYVESASCFNRFPGSCNPLYGCAGDFGRKVMKMLRVAWLGLVALIAATFGAPALAQDYPNQRVTIVVPFGAGSVTRSEEHTSELQSLRHLVCRLLLEK